MTTTMTTTTTVTTTVATTKTTTIKTTTTMLCSGTDFPQCCLASVGRVWHHGSQTPPNPPHFIMRIGPMCGPILVIKGICFQIFSLSFHSYISLSLFGGNWKYLSGVWLMSQTLFDSIECISTTNIFSLLKTKMEPTTQFEIVVKKLPHRTYSLSHGLFKNSSRNWCWFLEKNWLRILPMHSSLPPRFGIQNSRRLDRISYLVWPAEKSSTKTRCMAFLFFSFNKQPNSSYKVRDVKHYYEDSDHF